MIHNMPSLQSSCTAWLVQRCYVLLALKQMCALAYHWENIVPYVMRMLSQLKMVRRSLLSEARSWPMALPSGISSMAAILMLEEAKILQACEEVKALGVCEIANYNCPGQIVITGIKLPLKQQVSDA